MKIHVNLCFTPKKTTGNNLFDTVELHREVETWANNIALQYIGARFTVEVLDCYTGDNPFVDDSQERLKF